MGQGLIQGLQRLRGLSPSRWARLWGAFCAFRVIGGILYLHLDLVVAHPGATAVNRCSDLSTGMSEAHTVPVHTTALCVSLLQSAPAIVLAPPDMPETVQGPTRPMPVLMKGEQV